MHSLEFKERVLDKSVLFVDDDIVITEIMQHLLERFFKKTIIANNGSDAIKLYKDEQPDLVISDITMPIMNGLEMAEKLIKYDENLNIIFTSGHSKIEYLVKMEKFGGCYIGKPLTKKVLFSAILKIFEEDPIIA